MLIISHTIIFKHILYKNLSLCTLDCLLAILQPKIVFMISCALLPTVIRLLHACQEMSHQTNEPRHDKTNKMSVRPAKTQISLGIRPVWSESSLSAWRNLVSLATHWAHSEDSGPPSLIWVFAGRTLALLVFVVSRLICLTLKFSEIQVLRTNCTEIC